MQGVVGFQRRCSCKVQGLGAEDEGLRSLPRGPIVVPFWDYLIGFYI